MAYKNSILVRLLVLQTIGLSIMDINPCLGKQEAFEKCWAHSPLRAAARRLFYIAIHQVSLLSHATCASMSTTTTTTTTTTTRDRGDRYGPIEWAQKHTTLLNIWMR